MCSFQTYALAPPRASADGRSPDSDSAGLKGRGVTKSLSGEPVCMRQGNQSRIQKALNAQILISCFLKNHLCHVICLQTDLLWLPASTTRDPV